MTIYVVEQLYDYTIQIGWSTSQKVAEQMCEEYSKESSRPCWVNKYTTNKNNWSEFDCD